MLKYTTIFSLLLFMGLPLYAQSEAYKSSYKQGIRDGISKESLTIDLGTGLFYGPDFLGSKNYRLRIIPNLKLTYGANFSFSYEGIKYFLFNTGSLTGGVIGKVEFERRANDKDPLSISGSKSTALNGLGNIPTSFQTGIFGTYSFNGYSVEGELLEGITGKNEFIGKIGLKRLDDIHQFLYTDGPPLISIEGVETHFVNSQYNNEYFGVNAVQSAQSGLPQYIARSGILTYGLSNNLILPINRSLSLVTLLGYERLNGSAANSSLVTLRGSRNQYRFALFMVYKFENVITF